jgi:hypothetical protein
LAMDGLHAGGLAERSTGHRHERGGNRQRHIGRAETGGQRVAAAFAPARRKVSPSGRARRLDNKVIHCLSRPRIGLVFQLLVGGNGGA